MIKEDLELRQNFLSSNKKIARCSFGDFFKVGDKVKHEGADDTKEATIQSFEFDEDSCEVKVHTTLGSCHLDFLYKD